MALSTESVATSEHGYSIETLRYLRDMQLKQARRDRSIGRVDGFNAGIEYAREWHRDLMRAILVRRMAAS